jgi:hypothetical protein
MSILVDHGVTDRDSQTPHYFAHWSSLLEGLNVPLVFRMLAPHEEM